MAFCSSATARPWRFTEIRGRSPPASKWCSSHITAATWSGRAGRWSRRARPAVAPEAEKDLFTGVAEFWDQYRTKRFHDYANQSSRILAEPLRYARTVRGGDSVEGIQVLETPGYTRGAVSYLIEVDGKRIACTGDLIYGDGELLDLFSLQDAIRSERGRLSRLCGARGRRGGQPAQDRRLEAGPADSGARSRDPQSQAGHRGPHRSACRRCSPATSPLMRCASIAATKDPRHGRARAGPTPLEWMPTAEKVQEKLPEWIIPITNSRLIVSRTGAAFLVDAATSAWWTRWRG